MNLAGEISSKAIVNYADIVRKTIREIGYDDSKKGFDADTCGVLIALDGQSDDIAMGVDVGRGDHDEQGAGDQGIMFGYACDETDELMPLPILLSHKLTAQLAKVRKEGTLPYLRPDAKSQVSVEYVDGKPARITAVVISSQHDEIYNGEELTNEILREGIRKAVIDPVVPGDMIDAETVFHINPTGKFVIGGPQGDCGLTGRKIIVDTYGGMGNTVAVPLVEKTHRRLTEVPLTWRDTSLKM